MFATVLIGNRGIGICDKDSTTAFVKCGGEIGITAAAVQIDCRCIVDIINRNDKFLIIGGAARIRGSDTDDAARLGFFIQNNNGLELATGNLEGSIIVIRTIAYSAAIGFQAIGIGMSRAQGVQYSKKKKD